MEIVGRISNELNAVTLKKYYYYYLIVIMKDEEFAGPHHEGPFSQESE